MESQKEQALHPLLLPLCVLVCGGAMIGVFRLLGKLDDSVLYGAVLGCGEDHPHHAMRVSVDAPRGCR